MGQEYRVDLSALDNVVKKLNGVLKELGSAHSDAKYKTELPASALGVSAGKGKFSEAENLTQAHKMMKTHIEEIVQHLNDVMDKFGQKTKKAHGEYQNQEAEVTKNMSGG